MRYTVGIHPHFIEAVSVDNQINGIIALVSQGILLVYVKLVLVTLQCAIMGSV